MEPSSSPFSSSSLLGKGSAILGGEREECNEEGGSVRRLCLRRGDSGVSDTSWSLGYLNSCEGGRSIIGASV